MDNTEKKNENKGYLKQFIIIILISLFIRNFIFTIGHVPSESMVGTLNVGDKFYINRLAYLNNKPQVGDVVVFKGDNDNKYLVKRIIAKGGDEIAFKEGKVFVNGVGIEESYVTGNTYHPNNEIDHIIVKDGNYYMLGDNREHSRDSRYFGSIRGEAIIGKAEFKVSLSKGIDPIN